MAVQEAEPELFFGRAGEVVEDEQLQALGFAVAAARHDVQVLEPRLARDGEGESGRVEVGERGACCDGVQKIGGGVVRFGDGVELGGAVPFHERVNRGGELVAQCAKQRRVADVVAVERRDGVLNRVGGVFEIGRERDAKQGAGGVVVGGRAQGGGGCIQDIAYKAPNLRLVAFEVAQVLQRIAEAFAQLYARYNVSEGIVHGEVVGQRRGGRLCGEGLAEFGQQVDERRVAAVAVATGGRLRRFA